MAVPAPFARVLTYQSTPLARAPPRLAPHSLSFPPPPTLLRHGAVPAAPRLHPAPGVPPRRGRAACSATPRPDFAQILTDKNDSSPVVVYSKSWCPYCSQVKKLFVSLGVEANVIELDSYADGEQIQDALFDLTGQRTVPNVFIGGKHIGGCDDTMRLKQAGELRVLLEAAGVSLNE